MRRKGTSFSNQQPIGKDTITKMIREGFNILGIERWHRLNPHALRGHFVSILANDPSINDSERLAACRHRSLKTNQKYQQRGQAQECRRLKALLPGSSSTATSPDIKKPSATPQLQDLSLSAMSVTYTPSPSTKTTSTVAASSTYASSTIMPPSP